MSREKPIKDFGELLLRMGEGAVAQREREKKAGGIPKVYSYSPSHWYKSLTAEDREIALRLLVKYLRGLRDDSISLTQLADISREFEKIVHAPISVLKNTTKLNVIKKYLPDEPIDWLPEEKEEA